MRDDHSFYFGEYPHVVANVEMHSAVAIPLQSKHSFCTTFAAVVAVEVHLFSSASNVLPTPLYFPIFVEEIFNIFPAPIFKFPHLKTLDILDDSIH